MSVKHSCSARTADVDRLPVILGTRLRRSTRPRRRTRLTLLLHRHRARCKASAEQSSLSEPYRLTRYTEHLDCDLVGCVQVCM